VTVLRPDGVSLPFLGLRPHPPKSGLERFQKTSTFLAATVPDRVELGLGLTITEQIISLHVELLPEGCYLATSEAIPGLVAQGRTVAETLETRAMWRSDSLKHVQNAESSRP
jgi:hypothetical protein